MSPALQADSLPFEPPGKPKVGTEGTYLNRIKPFKNKSTTNIILNSKSLPTSQEEDNGAHFHHFSQHSIGSSSHSN